MERNVGAPKHISPICWPTFGIGTDNAEQVTGTNYRWCRDFAERNGVPIYKIGRKFLIDGPKFFEALKSFSDSSEGEREVDGATAILAGLGLKVRQ
jgi:hypothetical protein